MKISSIKVATVFTELERFYRTQYGYYTGKETVIVAVETDDGLMGFGEVTPYPPFIGESASTVKSMIDKILAPELIGMDPSNINRINCKLDKLLYGNSCAKTALDYALYDLLGKCLSVPLYKLLGGLCRDEVAVSWVVPASDPETMAKEAAQKEGEGYKHIKIKLTGDIEMDKKRVEEVGQSIKKASLGVDANTCFDSKSIMKILPVMERNNVWILEQPFKEEEDEELPSLKEKTKLTILADESLRSLAAAWKIAKGNYVDAFNVKIAKFGGLTNAMKIVSLAEISQKACMIGSMLEHEIGTMFGVHLAASREVISLPNDLSTPLLYKERLSDEFKIEEGVVKVPRKPGIGIAVKQRYLDLLS